MKECPHCSDEINKVYHGGQCPKIKSIEYYRSGEIKKIEFKEYYPNYPTWTDTDSSTTVQWLTS